MIGRKRTASKIRHFQLSIFHYPEGENPRNALGFMPCQSVFLQAEALYNGLYGMDRGNGNTIAIGNEAVMAFPPLYTFRVESLQHHPVTQPTTRTQSTQSVLITVLKPPLLEKYSKDGILAV
ncbi:MAG: hypothetical protein LBG27_11500 [Spirochaetaceae bacterium]|jgi:hypothetical protein|nr:hypothetical protein [Spirochaetaceae bacterium]